MDRMDPTLEDVAREAGVSTATVSRVLNAPDRVREDTRRRVEAVIARLGYTPHFGGRALASRRTDTVGVVIPTMENAIFARGVQAMQTRLSEAGVTLLIASSNYRPEQEAAQVRAILGRGVDGVALIGEERDEAVHALLRARGVPYVVMWTWRPDSPHLCVGFDNDAAAEGLAQRVLEAGHRRIAMIAGVTAGNDRARLRVIGVTRALAQAGLALPPERYREAEYALEAGAAAAAALLEGPDRPTAIICGNDVLAAGAMVAARRLGLRAPRDLSVVGFDDIELAALLDPALTTVHAPHRRMGEAAAAALLALRAGQAAASVRLDTWIVERESLGSPPDNLV